MKASYPPLVVNEVELAEHRRQWSVLKRRVGDKWYRCYSLSSGRQSRDYVPEDIYYSVIEPLLNNRESRHFRGNKGLYQLMWDPDLFPRTIVRNLSGFEYDGSFCRVDEDRWNSLLAAEDKVVLKPSLHSGGGRDIHIFTRAEGQLRDRNGDTLTLDRLRKTYRGDHVIQEFIQQHEYFSRLNESSLNTFRVFTYRSVATDNIEILGHIIGDESRFDRLNV